MQFRTRAIHVGNEPDPANRRRRPPDPSGHHVRAARRRRLGRIRLLAQRQSHPPGVRVDPGRARVGHAGPWPLPRAWPPSHCATMLLAQRRSRPGRHRRLWRHLPAAAQDDQSRGHRGFAGAHRPTWPRWSGAITPRTKMLWIETPGNPLLSITDIAACGRVGPTARGLLLAVDNTFATPVLTRPLELGADIVMHSATKYIGGHSDVLGGALVVRDRDLSTGSTSCRTPPARSWPRWRPFSARAGSKPSTCGCASNAAPPPAIAEFLAGDRRVARVFYPGLARPSRPRAGQRQMDGAGRGHLSFEVAGDYRAPSGWPSRPSCSNWPSAWAPSNR